MATTPLHMQQSTRAGRVGALDVHNCAERRVWDALSEDTPVSVTRLCMGTTFTPQYTRKVLGLLQQGGLAKVETKGGLALWSRCGEVGAVIRHVKSRSEPSGARTRRALCLYVWRLLHRSRASMDADTISKHLRTPGPEIYTALRTLKAAGLIRFLRVQNRGERSTWESIGSPSYARTTRTRRPPNGGARRAARPQVVQNRPMINSIWALGMVASASSEAQD